MVEALAAFVARELEVLRATGPADAAAALARLADEITRLAPEWTAAGESADQVRALVDLATTLRAVADQAGPERRLERAIAALAELAPLRKRVPFWKRRKGE